MSLVIRPEMRQTVPLVSDPSGAVLVRGTRVPLDTIVAAFRAGQSAEEIALGYPTLTLADVYAVLAYYLRHQEDVDAYVERRGDQARALRTHIETAQPGTGIRERLLARHAARQTNR